MNKPKLNKDWVPRTGLVPFTGILVGRGLKEGGLLSIKPTKISQFKKFPVENQSEEKTGKKHKAPKQKTQFFFS